MHSTNADGTKYQRDSGRSANLTRGDKEDGRNELQSYAGPSGRIAKGKFDPALLDKFRKFVWASSIMIEGCQDQKSFRQHFTGIWADRLSVSITMDGG